MSATPTNHHAEPCPQCGQKLTVEQELDKLSNPTGHCLDCLAEAAESSEEEEIA